jgi:hypothetical protein
LGAAQTQALTELSDDSLSKVQGAGLAFAMDNFSFRMAPTSYIELTGTEAQGLGWDRGDARYYGLSITNGAMPEGTDWHGSGTAAYQDGGDYIFGNEFLASPLGNGSPINLDSEGGPDNPYGIGAFASIYDPYVLRAYQYEGYDYAGNDLDNTTDMPTVMELIGPSKTNPWRWAFWGELEVDRSTQTDGADNNSVVIGSGGADFLQSQTIIHGKPVTVDGRPARLRLMHTTNNPDGDTFGITYESALSGDFRFSVRQQADSEDRLHWVPNFEDNEGMYFKKVDAYLPLGQLHYQALTLDAVRTGSERGNFVIELTRIPNLKAVYEDFYCSGEECSLDANNNITNPNSDTVGYVRWGDWEGVDISYETRTGDIPWTTEIEGAETTYKQSVVTDPYGNLPGVNSTGNGIYFVGGATGCSSGATCVPVAPSMADSGDPSITNIGISRIEGMRIHHMKITTLGAGQP